MSEARFTQGKLDVTFIPGGGYGIVPKGDK